MRLPGDGTLVDAGACQTTRRVSHATFRGDPVLFGPRGRHGNKGLTGFTVRQDKCTIAWGTIRMAALNLTVKLAFDSGTEEVQSARFGEAWAGAREVDSPKAASPTYRSSMQTAPAESVLVDSSSFIRLC